MQYTKAVRKDTNLLIAIAGGTGTGKTYSAMELATGLCDGGPFLFIDTEGRRGLHYADLFDFEHHELQPPFHPEKYLPPIIEAEERGFKAVVIDSMSHEWAGEGGVIELADEAKRRVKNEVAAWAEPKKRHKKMMNRLIQARAHLIFCLRAKRNTDMSEKDERGKTIVRITEPQPVCEKDFMYEMTASFTMQNGRPGIPDMNLEHKIHDMHRFAFPPGRQVTRESGLLLGAWARGDDIGGRNKDLWDRARKAAYEGWDVLKLFVETQLTDEERDLLRPVSGELKALAREASEQRDIGPGGEVPMGQDEQYFDDDLFEPVGADEAVANLFGDPA